MGKPTGFIEYEREKTPYRPVEERIQDWNQVMKPWPVEPLKTQAARCMDCGIPLSSRLPAWQYDPRLERPGVSGSMGRSDQTFTRNQ